MDKKDAFAVREVKNFFRYSVMQSDGNSFCGDFVLDGMNMAYSNQVRIIEENSYIKYAAHNNQELINWV